MIDVVIPLGAGSRMNNLELRYCLRGIDTYLAGVRNVFIVGDKPKWLTNVIHLSATDNESSQRIQRNIASKIVIAANHPLITDDFLFMNDDHFLLKSVAAKYFPLHYKGLLEEDQSTKKQHFPYWKTLNNTIRITDPMMLNYDTHCPIVYNKHLFLRTIQNLNWATPYGYCIKTLYCFMNKLQGEYYPDLKIEKVYKVAEIMELIKDRPYFSIGDTSRHGEIKQVLQTLFPTPSKYEL